MKYLRLCLLPHFIGGGIFVTVFAVRQPTELVQRPVGTTLAVKQPAEFVQHAAGGAEVSSLLTDHYTGGFSLNDGPKVMNAHSLGRQIGFFYGDRATNPDVRDALKTFHMGVKSNVVCTLLVWQITADPYL